MARRPCSCSSREKSSGTSPSEHTSPALFTYQNLPSTPAGFKWGHPQSQTDLYIYIFWFTKYFYLEIKSKINPIEFESRRPDLWYGRPHYWTEGWKCHRLICWRPACWSSCGGRWIRSLLSGSTWAGWSVSKWAVRPHLTDGDSKKWNNE